MYMQYIYIYVWLCLQIWKLQEVCLELGYSNFHGYDLSKPLELVISQGGYPTVPVTSVIDPREMDFVSWSYDIPNINGKSKIAAMETSHHQPDMVYIEYIVPYH